jgi:hypothetical protein
MEVNTSFDSDDSSADTKREDGIAWPMPAYVTNQTRASSRATT